MRTQRNIQGFTVIEMLVVISIIVILSALLFPVFQSSREKARQTHCISRLHALNMAVRQFFLDHQRYPRTLTDLESYLGIKVDTDRASVTFGQFVSNGDAGLCLDDFRRVVDPQAARSSFAGYGIEPDRPQAPVAQIGLDCTDVAPARYASRHPENCPDSTTATFGNYDRANPAATSALPNTLQRHWNHWGFDNFGLALRRANSPYFTHTCFVRGQCAADGVLPAGIPGWDDYPALANPAAPDHTIVTHCWHHRPITGGWDQAANQWTGSSREIILRLGGDVRVVPTTAMSDGNPSRWVRGEQVAGDTQ